MLPVSRHEGEGDGKPEGRLALDLAQAYGNLSCYLVPGPGRFDHGMAGTVNPLVEKPVQLPAGLGFHDGLEVPGQHGLIAVFAVEAPDALEEGLVTHEPPEHVEHQPAFAVVVGVQQVEQIRYAWIEDGGGITTVRVEVASPAPGQHLLKPLVAVGFFKKQGAEVGGEPLAEPQVMPIGFGYRIAEPLVGDLVRDHGFVPFGSGYAFFRKKDGTGVLHAAETGGGLHQREFRVGIGSNQPGIVGQHVRGTGEIRRSRVPVLGEEIVRNGDPLPGPGPDDGKARRADHHAVRRNGRVGLPVRSFSFRRDGPCLQQPAVGYHVVGRRRGDDEFDRGLVVGVVHPGKPVPRPVRPVVREHRPVAELVFLYEQPVRGLAVIDDGHRDGVARRVAVPKRNTQSAVPVLKVRAFAIDRYPLHGERDEVEGQSLPPVGQHLRQDRGFAPDGLT